MAKFGEILQELRKDRGLSQQDLGKILHVTPGTISNYENNVSLPGVERLVEMAEFFQVSTDYLLGRCSSRLSPDAWNKAALGERTVGELIHTIRGLSCHWLVPGPTGGTGFLMRRWIPCPTTQLRTSWNNKVFWMIWTACVGFGPNWTRAANTS